MITIKGVVVRGLGDANKTLKIQMPYFSGLIPEVKDCHCASINLQLEQGLRVFNPDFLTPPIPWAGPPGEVFSFLRIGFEAPIGRSSRPAWIYIPHGSPHYRDPFHIEVITRYIESIAYGVYCQVHIQKPYRTIPLIIT